MQATVIDHVCFFETSLCSRWWFRHYFYTTTLRRNGEDWVCTSHPSGEPASNTFDGYTMRPIFTPEVAAMLPPEGLPQGVLGLPPLAGGLNETNRDAAIKANGGVIWRYPTHGTFNVWAAGVYNEFAEREL